MAAGSDAAVALREVARLLRMLGKAHQEAANAARSAISLGNGDHLSGVLNEAEMLGYSWEDIEEAAFDLIQLDTIVESEDDESLVRFRQLLDARRGNWQ